MNTPKNIPADDQFFQKLLLVLLVAIVFAAVLNHYEAVLRGLAFIGNASGTCSIRFSSGSPLPLCSTSPKRV